jgi:DNA-binding transcriptional regulator YiaG
MLQRCGEALYGPLWHNNLARDLDISDRTLRRWMSGANDVPAGVRDELRNLVQRRRTELTEIIGKL